MASFVFDIWARTHRDGASTRSKGWAAGCRGVKSTQEFKAIEVTREEIVVGLDIGTTKVGTVIAAGDAAGSLRVIGVGSTPSRGIKRGVVVDVEETVAAIQHSVERAAHMAGVKVEGVIVGVTGEHIESSNCHAAVTVAGGQGTISRDDVRRVLQAAALEVPRDREIIHSLPRTFTVDGHGGVYRPIGMTGQKLEVETHIVTGKAPYLQNAVQCVERAGLKVEALVLEPIATAEAVTTADEREMGVILIDIGGGTSDIAVFHDGTIVYSGVLPVGGNHVTRDIAIGLRTPFEVAEDLKLESGAATREMIPHGEALEITMAGTNERLRIPRAILGEIIEARMSELFELARDMMHQSGARKRLPGGVILSGGGALLPGAIELANSVFAMPVRLGYPHDVTGWSDQVATPQLATGVGLCRFALTQRQSPNNQAVIPRIAALEGRRIWGAIVAGENEAATPGFISDSRPKETSKGAPLLDIVPNIMESSPLAPSPILIPPATLTDKISDVSAVAAPVINASASSQSAAETLASSSAAPVAATKDVAPIVTSSAASQSGAPEISAATPIASDTKPAVTGSEFEAPRFEARPTPLRSESSRNQTPRGEISRDGARSETSRGEGVRTEVIRPESTRTSESSSDNSYARNTARPAGRPSGGTNSSSNSGGARRSTAPTESGARAGNSDSSERQGQNRGADDIFRRTDSPPERAKSVIKLPPAQQKWWEKLKSFLGFEKMDD